MIVYSGMKKDFMIAVDNDTIAAEIEDNIYNKMHRKTGTTEFRSWENSLEYMYKVLRSKAGILGSSSAEMKAKGNIYKKSSKMNI